MFVKICGITNLDDALVAAEAGANALGFNFWRPGKRYIAPETARQIIVQLPAGVMTVGVFVDEDAGEVERIARDLCLSAAQLHGRETPEYVARLRPICPVRGAGGSECFQQPGGTERTGDRSPLGLWKVFRVDESFQAAHLAAYSVDAFLLDGAGSAPGGNAARFDWQCARQARAFGRIILAGGLDPENVAEAVRMVRPWGVDVASGVESAPGRKDHRRVRQFIAAAREAGG